MATPIKTVRGGVIVPQWGNADRDEKDKIKVHFRFLSFAEQQALTFYDDLGKTLAYDSRQMEAMIDKVENLSIEDETGEVKDLVSGADIINEPAAEGLCLELWLEFRKRSAIDKKKLKSE